MIKRYIPNSNIQNYHKIKIKYINSMNEWMGFLIFGYKSNVPSLSGYCHTKFWLNIYRSPSSASGHHHSTHVTSSHGSNHMTSHPITTTADHHPNFIIPLGPVPATNALMNGDVYAELPRRRMGGGSVAGSSCSGGGGYASRKDWRERGGAGHNSPRAGRRHHGHAHESHYKHSSHQYQVRF